MTIKNNKLLTLEALRGIAAVGVALYHFRLGSHLQTSGITEGWYLLVDFFFVLSGFVLTHAYLDRLHSKSDLLSFSIRRTGRLWPLHIFTLGILVATECGRWLTTYIGVHFQTNPPFSGAYDPKAIPSNIFLIHSLGVHDQLTWNGPSWSISVECAAYAIFAILAVNIQKTTIAAIGIIAFCGTLLFAYSETMNVTYDLGLLRCLICFFVGHLANLAYKKRMHSGIPHATLLEAISVCMAIIFICSADNGHIGFAAPIIFAPVVYIYAFQSGEISRFLYFKPFQHLGKVSYSIYMTHAILFIWIDYSVWIIERITKASYRRAILPSDTLSWTISSGNTYLDDALTIIYMLLVIGISSLTYRYVESRYRDYFNKKCNQTP